MQQLSQHSAANTFAQEALYIVPPTGTDTASDLFKKWNRMLDFQTGSGKDPFIPEEKTIRQWIADAQTDNEVLQDYMLRRWAVLGSEINRTAFVQVVQNLLRKLLDKLFATFQRNDSISFNNEILSMLCQPFEQTLVFMQEFFPGYFNWQEKMPQCLLAISNQEIKSSSFESEKRLQAEGVEVEGLRQLVANHLRLFWHRKEGVTYSEMLYYKNLLQEVRSIAEPINEDNLRALLYFLNFNEPSFVAYECERLRHTAGAFETPKQKVGVLKWEQKRTNQLTVTTVGVYSQQFSPLKEQINAWINEEIRFVESGYYTAAPEINSGYADKIHTTLSVAKLALIIRLLVLDKIIINRTVAPMLRIVAKVFSTLQKDDVSFTSLETKYHAPDKTTINAVRDMLFKWINLLAKL